MRTAASTWRRIGALLVEEGLLDADQLAEAFEEQERTGRRLGEIAVERGWIEARELLAALAAQAGLPAVDLSELAVDEEVAALLPERLVRRYGALPLKRLDDGAILVGVTDPTNLAVLDDLRLALGIKLVFALVSPDDFDFAVRRIFRANVELDEVAETGPVEETIRREEIWQEATGSPAVRLVNAALGQAISDGASDVHFVPEEERLVVYARIDGITHELLEVPAAMRAAVISRLKIMGSLDIAERRIPQDGRVLVRLNGQPVDLRIAVLPTTHGERAVLRVLHRAAGGLTLAELGMAPDALATFAEEVEQPHGAVIVCGPTGSGKTTTLYAALSLLNQPGRVLMTIEDPVEYEIPGVSQIEVNVRHGLTFARGLRTILRSDPDGLLVGEVRDEETARIAIQAGMTGHLVMTSLHTHNAASSIARLKDMGVAPSLLASAVNCIVAQRLARRLCADCAEPYEASAEELVRVGLAPEAGTVVLHRARGCARCLETGFRGRVGLYEVMPVRGRLRSLIESSTEDIFAAAVASGMRTLRQDGCRLALAGVTSLDEVERVTGHRVS